MNPEIETRIYIAALDRCSGSKKAPCRSRWYIIRASQLASYLNLVQESRVESDLSMVVEALEAAVPRTLEKR